VDDLPCWMKTKYGPMIAMPYTVELNNVPMYAIENQSTDELYRRVEVTLKVLEEEMKTHARVMTLALHPHIIGFPHRVLLPGQGIGRSHGAGRYGLRHRQRDPRLVRRCRWDLWRERGLRATSHEPAPGGHSVRWRAGEGGTSSRGPAVRRIAHSVSWYLGSIRRTNQEMA
jgi:hypothetical protein